MSSSDSSPKAESEIEEGKGEKHYDNIQDERQEEIEEPFHEKPQRPHLGAPLQQTRSRSSARSRSYTDGYSHFEQDDDEAKDERSPDDDAPEEGKEFEVQFDGDSDPMNPKNRPKWRKWIIVLIGSGCSLCVTCASALYTSTYEQMEQEFNISRELATVGLTTYVCGLALGPMFLAPLSEFYGRRIIYLSAFGMFFIW